MQTDGFPAPLATVDAPTPRSTSPFMAAIHATRGRSQRHRDLFPVPERYLFEGVGTSVCAMNSNPRLPVARRPGRRRDADTLPLKVCLELNLATLTEPVHRLRRGGKPDSFAVIDLFEKLAIEPTPKTLGREAPA